MKKILIICVLMLALIVLLGCDLDDQTTTVTNKNTTAAITTTDGMMTSLETTESSQNTTTTTGTTTTGTTTTGTTTTGTTTTTVTTTTTETTTETTVEDTATIYFEENGGSEVAPITQSVGTYVQQPADPVLDGHVFDGWFLDAGLTNMYSFSDMPEQDITLYAKWVPVVTTTDQLKDALEAFDFVCGTTVCEYEYTSGFTYVVDLAQNTFTYDKTQEDQDGSYYRTEIETIVIDTNWDVSVVYSEEEDYGIYHYTNMTISGNALSASYSVDSFSSNHRSESGVKDDLVQNATMFIAFVEAILNEAGITMDDLN